MVDHERVCVLIPTYNEAETIGDVVGSFREEGFENVLVVDGGSTDGTRDVAADAGARVVEQSGRGKGNMKGQAVREGLHMSEADVVLMLDGDWTYRAEDAEAMLEPVFAGRADHVIGNRFADMEPGAITRLNAVGNRVINLGFRLIHGRDYVDILSGYRALTREATERVSLSEDGFGIETELAVECVKHNVRTEVVPIRYRRRPGDSETNLNPFRDGADIILTLYRMAKTSNPLFYFGSVGIASTLTGVGLGAWVAYEWVVRGISHEVIAVVGSFAILFGVQLLMFGVLSDMMVTVNREQTRRLEELARRLSDDESPGFSSGGSPGSGDTAGDGAVGDARPEDAGVVEAADSSED
ncbi:MAG: S-layer glycoprotein N-glycosyltransferase AglJ [Haloarculaceae archaeon]